MVRAVQALPQLAYYISEARPGGRNCRLNRLGPVMHHSNSQPAHAAWPSLPDNKTWTNAKPRHDSDGTCRHMSTLRLTFLTPTLPLHRSLRSAEADRPTRHELRRHVAAAAAARTRQGGDPSV